MTMADPPTPDSADVLLPSPPSERRAWLIAGLICCVGVAVLAAVLSGLVGQRTSTPAALPPVVPVAAATPTPGAGAAASVLSGAGAGAAESGARAQGGPARGRSASVIVAQPSRLQQSLDARRLVDQTQTHIYA